MGAETVKVEGQWWWCQSTMMRMPMKTPPATSSSYVGVNNNPLSQEAQEERLSPVAFETLARRRNGEEGTCPLVLSINHQWTLPTLSHRGAASSTSKKPKVIKDSTNWLLNHAKKRVDRSNQGLIALTQINKKKEKGWLRAVEGITAGKQTNKKRETIDVGVAPVIAHCKRHSAHSSGTCMGGVKTHNLQSGGKRLRQ